MLQRRESILGCLIAVPILLLLAVGPARAESGTVEVAVSAAADDAEEDHLGNVTLNEAVLDMGGNYRSLGLRFANVQIPVNAQITRAYIEFTTAAKDPILTSFSIRGQSSDSATPFSASLFDISTRTTYNPAVTWAMDYSWDTLGQVHQTPDLKAIVQTIVKRPGWQPGAALGFIFTGTENIFRKAKSYDSEPGSAPKIHIEYADSVVDVPIAASTDDMHQDGFRGTVTNGPELFISGSSTRVTGLRFTNVNIPQGSLIKRAEVRFTANQAHPAEAGTVNIHGFTGSNSYRGTFSTSIYMSVDDRSRKTPRTAYLQWSNFPALAAGQVFATDDITSIVQPIVGQSTWDLSKTILIYFTTGSTAVTRRAYSIDYTANPSLAPSLHIEYIPPLSQGGANWAVPVLDKVLIHRTCFEGSTADRQMFTLTNSGAQTYNYEFSTYQSPEPGYPTGWFSVTPAIGNGSLGPGESQAFTVSYNPDGLALGLYEATLRFYSSGSVPAVVNASVKLEVVENTLQCGDTPLYTRTVTDPAVLVLLDLSESMDDTIDLLGEDDLNARTPDIRGVVQEIVFRDGWKAGNAMAFILEKTGGAGLRWPRSFDGYNPSAARLHVEYNDGTGIKSIDARIKKSTDDIDARSGGVFFDATSLKMADQGNGLGVGLRFENIAIPKNTNIHAAYIQMVPAQSDSGAVNLAIYGHNHDDAPTFSHIVVGGAILGRVKTNASVAWSVPAWTGVMTERKIDIAKTAIKEMVKDKAIAWGFGTWASVPPYDTLPIQDPDPQTYTLVNVGCKPHSAGHESRITAAVDAVDAMTNPLSHTPFSPSLVGAKQYFQGLKKDDFPAGAPLQDGSLFQSIDCQPKFAIIVTDGKGDVDSTPENVRSRVQALGQLKVSVTGIGFGLTDTESEQLHALAVEANAQGKASDTDTLYPMHPLDRDGKAIPFMALAKNDLLESFRTILANVKGASFIGSAPAATNSTDLGDIALVTSFNAADWSGDLKAVAKGAGGAWNEVLWSAAAEMPVTRSLWTLNDAKQLVPYTDATIEGDNYLCKTLGDIVNSTPMVVGPPPFFYNFDNYKNFKIDKSITNPRDPMVYVAANDGMLHAFELGTGIEKWAFLAPNLKDKLKKSVPGSSYDMCSSTYCYQSLFDGSAQAADVYGTFDGTKKWRTMIVVGQRAGGSAYYAFDVTSGESFDQSSDPARFLWEYKVDTADGDTNAKGTEAWAEASIDRVDDGRRNYDGSSRGYPPAWAVFFTSSYAVNDNDESVLSGLFGIEADTGLGLWDVSGEPFYYMDDDPLWRTDRVAIGGMRRGGISQGNFIPGERVTGLTSNATGEVVSCDGWWIIMKNIEGSFCFGETLKGSLGGSGWMSQLTVHKDQLDPEATYLPSNQHRDALNAPVVVDLDADHKADAIYVGNLYGTLFRVRNISKGLHPKVTKLFQFDPMPASPEEHPIRGKATFAWSDVNGTVWVYWGTGAYEQVTDKVSTAPQYFFGVKDVKDLPDSQAPPSVPYKLTNLVPLEANFATGIFNEVTRKLRVMAGTNANAASWYVKLHVPQSGGSERMFTKPLAVGGVVFFTTFLPDADACSGSGETYLFALDYTTGLPPDKPVFDLNKDGKFNDGDKVEVNGVKVVPAGVFIGRGKGSHPVLYKDTIFITSAIAHHTGIELQAEDQNLTGLHTIDVTLPQHRVRMESWKHN